MRKQVQKSDGQQVLQKTSVESTILLGGSSAQKAAPNKAAWGSGAR
jgi:hypothetical protein